MNYLSPAWLEGLGDPKYRGTGRTERMIKLMSLRICEIERIKKPETILLVAEPYSHKENIYKATFIILRKIMRLKKLEFTTIIKGNPEYFYIVPSTLYGIKIKESDIFIDHYVYEKNDNPSFVRYRCNFFELLNKIIIPD